MKLVCEFNSVKRCAVRARWSSSSMHECCSWRATSGVCEKLLWASYSACAQISPTWLTRIRPALCFCSCSVNVQLSTCAAGLGRELWPVQRPCAEHDQMPSTGDLDEEKT